MKINNEMCNLQFKKCNLKCRPKIKTFSILFSRFKYEMTFSDNRSCSEMHEILSVRSITLFLEYI